MRIGTSTFVALACAAVFATLAGCQQPRRCGAIGEPCCLVEGVGYGCVQDAFCNLGACRPSPPSACPGVFGECDVGLQNCAGQASCQLGSSSTVCQPSGLGIDGDPCEGVEDCATGHYCSVSSGLCHRYCCNNADACVPGQQCASSGAEGIGFCVGNPCDPVGGGGCEPGAGCFVFTGSSGTLITGCLPAGIGTHGSRCEVLNDCAPGFACTTADECRAFCRPSEGCTGTCEPIPGVDDLGLCV